MSAVRSARIIGATVFTAAALLALVAVLDPVVNDMGTDAPSRCSTWVTVNRPDGGIGLACEVTP